VMLALFTRQVASLAFLPRFDVARHSQPSQLSQPQQHEHLVTLETPIHRRFLFQFTVCIAITTVFLADDNVSAAVPPRAPLEALLPACRVKLWVDRCVRLATKLTTDPSNSDTLAELENLLLQPQNFVGSFQLQGVPNRPAQQYLDTYKPMPGDLPFQQYLIKNGAVNTWKSLKRKEKEQESANELLAALNAYTDVLTFSSDSYVLNVDKRTRSSMIRQDRLPDTTQVIASDMGMRYLYRNELLTAMDDARAELSFQLKQQTVDATELLAILKEAQQACTRWFLLVDTKDVQEAMEALSNLK
jgi:hypothetical protein